MKKIKNKSNNYKLTFSNFYYKSNGKHIDDGELSESGNQCGITESISLEKESIDKLNKIQNTNYDETNTKEILQFYIEENVDNIDYKVEVIKNYVDEFIESDDIIQIEVKDGEYYMNDYGYNELFSIPNK